MFFKYLLLVFIINGANSAKILAIFWTPSQSHHIAGVPLLQALARKGHNVHLLSTFRDNVNISTYKQTRLTGLFDPLSDEEEDNDSIFNEVINLPEELKDKAEFFWRNRIVQEIIRNRYNKYNVVICLSYYSDHIFPIAHHLKAPLILFCPVSTNLMENKFVGAPNLPYYTHPYVEESPKTFFGRMGYFTFNGLLAIGDRFILMPLHEGITKTYLPEAPPLSKLNVSLILVNSHYSMESPRPYVPNMVPIGGHYSFKAAPLDAKCQEFLDSAVNGAILFSMGTNVKVATTFRIPVLMMTFAKLQGLKFLFKSEVPIPSAPENVMVVNWVTSQANVLAHPNLKIFITHGGLDGVTEAVYHGVPLFGIPFSGEQKANINFAVKCGFAVRLDYEELTEKALGRSLILMLRNPSYAENAKKRSALLRSQPIDPIEHGVWWVEHIIKYKGGEHLKNVGVKLEWYKLYMVDVVLFYVVLIVTTTFGYDFLVKWLVRKKLEWDLRPKVTKVAKVPKTPGIIRIKGRRPKMN